MKLIHSTPFPGKRKGLFPSFYSGTDKFCPLGREDSVCGPEGSQQEAEQPGGQGRETGQEPAHQGAEQSEISQAAAQQGQGQVQPHPPPLQPGGAEKEGRKNPQPEEQVQQLLGPAPGEQEAGEAEQVVIQPQKGARPQGKQKGLALGFQGEGHPRKRRERKLLGTSSS